MKIKNKLRKTKINTLLKREVLRELLNQCTDKQIEFFNRMYIDIEVIPYDKMDFAIRQCEATILKNNQ